MLNQNNTGSYIYYKQATHSRTDFNFRSVESTYVITYDQTCNHLLKANYKVEPVWIVSIYKLYYVRSYDHDY